MPVTRTTKNRRSFLVNRLGPGLITGASDDDPSGIATYSQAGAQFGYLMLWTIPLTLPLMIGIQLVSARLGRVSGRGIASNIRKHYSPLMALPFAVLVVLANVINVGADVSAMGQSMKLLAGGSYILYVYLFALFSLLVQLFLPYRRYSAYLKWLALSLLVYVFAAFLLHVDWRAALRGTFMPRVVWSKEFFTTLIAVFGTTISPYLFVWQAASEVEEVDLEPKARPLKDAPMQAPYHLSRITFDTTVGMVVSAAIAYFIMIVAAAALHANGVTEIQTTAQAAKALVPVAGRFAQALFCAGVIGTGLLAVPVLAGSAAYAVAEAFRWRRSLEEKPAGAKWFYLVLTGVMVAGTAMCLLPFDPFKMLYWSAVLNGVAAVPVMIMLQLLSRRQAVMGSFCSSPWLQAVGWVATAAMALSVVGLIVTLFV
ncbi:Nramp family divalent metal transporter [Cupriavidus sp. 2TAF22]|uniref:Nramp family divalent metal transporter n=1 Tax=unclassified Cupriavidus TaxID=2640874 RepID=UPI003F922EFE